MNEQAALTAQKQMDIERVKQVRAAEIQKEAQLVQAEQARQTQIVRAEGERDASIRKAEGDKTRTVLAAEGALSQAQLGAQGIKVEGEAKATAEQLMLTAPVNAQITLAKEIGTNKGYQEYLVSIRTIEANQSVGQAQAKAQTSFANQPLVEASRTRSYTAAPLVPEKRSGGAGADAGEAGIDCGCRGRGVPQHGQQRRTAADGNDARGRISRVRRAHQGATPSGKMRRQAASPEPASVMR